MKIKKEISYYKYCKYNTCNSICCHKSKIYPSQIIWFYN